MLNSYALAADTTIPLKVKIHPRARRLTMRWDPITNHIKISIPSDRWHTKVLPFLEAHKDWISEQYLKAANNTSAELTDGMSIPIFGKSRLLRLIPSNRTPRIHLTDTELLCASAVPSRALPRFLKAQLKEYIIAKLRELDATPISITIRETRSRWGSCSRRGNLNFHWRLIFAPREVLDYLIIHEWSHRTHFDHSAAFWALVAKHDPLYKTHRDWLKTNGPSLYHLLKTPPQ